MKFICCVIKCRKVNISFINCFSCCKLLISVLFFCNKNIFFLCLVDDIEVMFYEIDVEIGKKIWEVGGVFVFIDVYR